MLTPGVSGISTITRAATPIRLRRPGKLAKTTFPNEIAAAVNQMRTMPTTGQPDGRFARPIIRGRITSYTVNATNQWNYNFTQQHKQTAGYGGWVDDPKGLEDHPCFSRAEDNNSGTGRQGNGVDVANLGDCEIQPIPVDTQVDLLPEILPDGKVEYWIIAAYNGIDLP